MSHVRAVALILVAAGTMASPGHAQMPGMPGSTRPISLVISGGLTLPSGELGNFHDSGFHYDASLLLTIPGLPIAFRPEFSLTQLKLKDPIGTGNFEGDVTKMFAAMANIELPLFGGFYALAGGGLLSLSVPGAVTGVGDESESKFVLDAGAGLRFRMGSVTGFLEARMGTASYDQGTVGFTKAQFIPITFGLVF